MSAVGRIVSVLAVIFLCADASAAERSMAELFSRPHTQELLMQMDLGLAPESVDRTIAAIEKARAAQGDAP
jgi:hypothetical protein